MAAEVRPTPTRGVPIVLDRERHLRYSLRTLREMLADLGPDALSSARLEESIAKLLWYGLRHEDPELTPEDVEELVDLEHLEAVVDAFVKATGARLRPAGAPSAEDGAAPPRPPTPAGGEAAAPPAATNETTPS